jgi:acyl transferase domain-containing protein
MKYVSTSFKSDCFFAACSAMPCFIKPYLPLLMSVAVLLLLGDPVEINAASDVLVAGQTRQHPLTLLASKSWVGHGEPAAGLIAVQHAAFAAAQRQRLPILHLRTFNPYITGIWEMLPQQAAGTGMAAAMQGGPLPLPGSEAAVISSTSSFAFMGTNAHTIVRTTAPSSAISTSSAGDVSRVTWVHAQAWVAPSVRLLARVAAAAAGKPGEVLLHADLASPQLSYIWDHQVSSPSIAFCSMHIWL